MANRKLTNELKPTRQKKMHLTIGMLTADISHKNDYSMWQGVVEAAHQRNVNVICFPGLHLHSPAGFDAQANAIFELVSAQKLDGLVIMAGAIAQLVGLEEKKAFLERFSPLPIVTLESDVAGIPDIYVDFFQNMRKAILHLIQVHNYRRIAFIRGPEGHHGANERYRAYVETLAECGIPFDPTLVTPPLKWDGRWGVTWLLDEQQVDFEAVVGVNDDAAIGAIEVLQGRGISVPEEVAVVGFDDVDQGRWITPPLTTVPLETYTSGRQALEMVLALIEGKPMPEQVVIPTELVIRQSCGCIDPIVTQAIVEPVTALPKDATEQTSLETVLSDRQEDILAAIKQTVKEEILKAKPDQIRQLLEAFAAAQSNPSNGIFLRTLDQILSQTMAIGGETEAWHQVVSVLRRQISPYLYDRETLLRAENLWQQARVLIGKAAQRSRGYQELQAERRMNILREVGAALITTFDSEALMNVLAHQLPRLDIRSAYLALYEDPKHPAGQARLLLAYNEQGRIEIEAENRIFSGLQLIPQDLWPREQPYSMVALPLYLQKDQLGFVLFGANPQDGPMHMALRGQISSALKGALLVEQEEKRARQLQTVTEVGTVVSTILDKTELLQSVVDLTKVSFNLYHAHIYLLNEAGDTLMLAAGAGEVGRHMVTQGWSISLTQEQSVVARAARNRQGVIENNVRKSPNWLPNPLLPKTNAELAVPIVIGEHVLGILDIQSDEVGHFTEEDVGIQTTLAGQVAVALQNARSFDEQQQAKILLAKRVRELNCLNEIGREIVETPAIPELLQWITERIPPAMQYPELCVAAIEYEGQVYGRPEATELPFQIVHGLRMGVEVVGRIYISYTEKHDFLDEESALLGGIASRVSGYIESRHLLEQIQQRAVEFEETSSFLDSVVDNIPIGIFVKRAQDLSYVGWNKGNEELVGLKKEEVLGKTDYDFHPPEMASHFVTKDRETLAGGKLVDIPEEPINTLHRGARFLHTRKVPVLGADGTPKYLLGISLDITERKQAEQDLIQQKEFFSKIINILPLGVMAKDVQNDFHFSIWNAKMEEMFGVKAAEMLGKTDYDYSDKEQADSYRQIDIAAIESGQVIDIPVEEITTVHGPRLAHTIKLPIFDNEGKPETLLVVLEDITERKGAEEALRASQERFALVVAGTQDGVWDWDIKNSTLYWSPRLKEMLGYRPAEIEINFDTFSSLLHPEDAETTGGALEAHLKHRTPYDVEQRLQAKSGEYVWFRVRGQAIWDEAGNPIRMTGSSMDITAQKAATAEHERLLADVEAAYRQYVRQEWKQFLGEQQGSWRIEYQPDAERSMSPIQHLTSNNRLAEVQDEVIREGITKVILGAGGNGHTVEPAIIAPIALRDQVIGTVSLQDTASDRKWTEEEMALVQTVSEQLALTVENLRLIDETGRQAAREKIIGDMTRQVWASGEMERVMETAAQQLGITLNASKVVIRLGTEDQLAKESSPQE